MPSPTTVLPPEAPLTSRAALPVAAEARSRATQALAKWVDIAQDRLDHELFMPTLSFDLAGRTPSIAFGGTRHLQLNPDLLAQNLEQFEAKVIPHELAHLIVAHLYGKKVALHGEEWVATMQALGVVPEIKVPLTAVAAPVSPSEANPGRAPTAPMLRFAAGLGEKHQVELPREVQTSFDDCTAFIKKWSQVGPAKTSMWTTPAQTPPGEPPSEKQLTYAATIAKRKKLVIPPEVLLSKALMSKWISASQ